MYMYMTCITLPSIKPHSHTQFQAFQYCTLKDNLSLVTIYIIGNIIPVAAQPKTHILQNTTNCSHVPPGILKFYMTFDPTLPSPTTPITVCLLHLLIIVRHIGTTASLVSPV